MRIKQDPPTFNASIYLRSKYSERETRWGPNKKKIRKFMIHAANSVRIAIDAGNFDASLFASHPIMSKYIKSKNLAVTSGKGNKIFYPKLHVETVNKPRSPRFETIP
jgi:hypothetical protein